MNSGTIVVGAVTRKEGVSKKTQKPWTKFTVHAESGGLTFDTFDGAMANIADQAVGKRAAVTWEPSDYGNNLESITVDPAADASAPFGSPMPDAKGEPQFTPAASKDDPDWDLIGLRKTRCALWAALFASGMLKGTASADAATYCTALVKAAEADIFERPDGRDQSDVPF